jgi:hypothetical protein
VLKFSTVAILKWIRSFGAQVQDLRTNAPAKIVALDAMHTYIGSKKNIAGYGVLLIEMEKKFLYWVQGGAFTGQKLWSAIKECATGRGMTGFWRPYTFLQSNTFRI